MGKIERPHRFLKPVRSIVLQAEFGGEVEAVAGGDGGRGVEAADPVGQGFIGCVAQSLWRDELFRPSTGWRFSTMNIPGMNGLDEIRTINSIGSIIDQVSPYRRDGDGIAKGPSPRGRAKLR